MSFMGSIVLCWMNFYLIVFVGERRADIGQQMGVNIFLAAGNQNGNKVPVCVGRETCCVGTAAPVAFDQPLTFEKGKGGADSLSADTVLFGDIGFRGKRGDSLL